MIDQWEMPKGIRAYDILLHEVGMEVMAFRMKNLTDSLIFIV